LEYLSTNWDSGLFRGSCEVVLAAVQNDGVALAYAAAELQSSREALAVGAGRGDIFFQMDWRYWRPLKYSSSPKLTSL